VGDGVEERTVGSLLWPKFLFRYVDSAGAVHTLYTTRGPFNESDRLATGVRMSLDVSGAGEDAELSIVNRTGIAMGLSLHCASPAAESAESLEVAFVVPERVDSRIGLRDLLPGTYSVWAEDPEATVEPATVEVRRGAATSETLTLRRRAARFVLTPADPALAGKDLARGHILLRPSSGTGSPGARAGATVDDRGEADVVRVAPGRYRVRYTYPFDMEFVPMGAGGGEIGRPKWVELGEVEIPEGVSEHALRVPPKSASKADPVRPAPGPR
jgi:hypothetical protein